MKTGANFCAVCGTQRLSGAGLLPSLPVAPAGGGSVSSSPGTTGGNALAPVPNSTPPAAQALLVTRQGQQTPVQDQMLVGRDPACHQFVDVDDVSRRHATIVAQGSGWAVLDLGSRNGTYVNDQPVLAATPIYHTDLIRFGATAEFALYDPAHQRPAGATSGPAPTAVITHAVSPIPSTGAIAASSSPTLYQWPRIPDAEGYVVAVRGPVVVERNDKAGKALLAVGLGLINPALAFVPFAMGKNQIMITTVRLKKIDDGRHAAVTFVGDVTSIVEDGDLVAVWGQVERGTVYGVDVYNYTTNAMIHISK